MATRLVLLALMVPGLTSGQMPTGWTYTPSRDAFDPTSLFVSYIDLAGCGPKGDDARADLSPCQHGHYIVSSVPPNQNFDTIATIAGCEYAAYEMYACSTAPPAEYGRHTMREFCMHSKFRCFQISKLPAVTICLPTPTSRIPPRILLSGMIRPSPLGAFAHF